MFEFVCNVFSVFAHSICADGVVRVQDFRAELFSEELL